MDETEKSGGFSRELERLRYLIDKSALAVLCSGSSLFPA